MREADDYRRGVLDDPRVLQAIRLHLAARPEWIGTRRACDVLDVDEKTWRKQRRKMEAAGILEVVEGSDAGIPYVRSRLTDYGLKIGELILAADALEAKARKRTEKQV